ncbi:GBP4 protein, partial [Calyptomena viridis]|nr:GBP4 protein [Calyptomena viridis]
LQGGPQNSWWLSVLTLLLSNSLIHSSHGDIDQQDMFQLRYLSELPELIRHKETPEPREHLWDSDRFALFFPNFVWIVWDWVLQLKGKDGWKISEEEQLEKVLRLQLGEC